MGVIGSYVNNLQLRRLPLSALEWEYDELSEAFVVHDTESGLMLGYMTRECAHTTVFTHESLIASWIWRVSALCIDAPEGSEPNLVPVDRK